VKYAISAFMVLESDDPGAVYYFLDRVSGFYEARQGRTRDGNRLIEFKVWVSTEQQKDIIFNDLKDVLETELYGKLSWHECWNFSETPQPCVIAETYIKEKPPEEPEPVIVNSLRFPTAILTQTNQNGTLASISNDETNAPGTWITASGSANTNLLVTFGTHVEQLNGQQSVNVLIRPSNTRPTNVTITLLEGITELNSVSISLSSQEHRQLTFTPDELADSTGSGLRVSITSTHGGGPANQRSVVEVGAIAWYAQYVGGDG
jgi:hypothetical protein